MLWRRFDVIMTLFLRPVPIIGPSSHWVPFSLVPISLVPQLAPVHHPFHWFPISLPSPKPYSFVPHPIGPPSHCHPPHPTHWSLIPLVPISLPSPTPYSFVPHPIGPPSHCHPTPYSLVPHPIGPPSHCHPPHPTHWSLIPLVPPSH